ncbi:MAG: hypothetical protein E3J72_05930 [Planctomycetota bacterium]|nr:MAG: hypothetical protein E3J72_05930 [Planctomycetota bacterium]
MYYGLAFALFFAGVGVLVAEVFIVSFGVLTLAALGCFVGGCVFAFYANQTFGMIFTLGNLIAVPIIVYLLIKYLPKTGVGRHLIRIKPSSEEKTVSDQVKKNKRFMGAHGVAVSMLRPAGIAEIDGERIDVVTEGVFLDPGTLLEVIEVSGNRLVVKRLERT